MLLQAFGIGSKNSTLPVMALGAITLKEALSSKVSEVFTSREHTKIVRVLETLR